MTANEFAYIEGTGNAVVEYLKKKWGNPDTQYVHFELWWEKGKAPCIEVETRSGEKITVRIN